jgi:biopolymer transport protein ExbB
MFHDFNWVEAIRTSPIMLVIFGCSIFTLAFALERAIYYWKRRGNPEAILSGVLDKVRSGNLKEAEWTLSSTSHPLGAVGAEMLESGALTPTAAEEKLDIALSEQRLLLERNLGFLGTMGSTAPLIGLLGTVWGIMRAFNDMANTGSAAPSVVAAGVAEALMTTAAGLVVAVPAVMLYNQFMRRMTVMLTETENHARILRSVLDAGEGGQVEQKTGKDRVSITRIA